MKLFIQIKNGLPFEHPIFEDNFVQAFPNVDINNLPPEFAQFIRVEPPKLGVYEKNQTVTYELVEGICTDVYRCEQMTAEEILNKQNLVKQKWAQIGRSSWIFNETTCDFDPPIPCPNDGKHYHWDESTISWVEVPATQE